jgi:recombinational DNA repair ATPase RecF
MRLDEVTIGEFKNLRDLRVDFDESSSYTVLVGENGAGKSNLIEALSLIFRNLDLDQEAPFTYHLKYRCRDHDIEVRARQINIRYSGRRNIQNRSTANYRASVSWQKIRTVVPSIGQPSCSAITPDRVTGLPRYLRSIGSGTTAGSLKPLLNVARN